MDENLFEGLDEELENLDVETVSVVAIEEVSAESIENATIELNDQETQEVEATAAAQAGDLNDIDSFIDQFKEPTKEEIKKKAKADAAAKKSEETKKAIADRQTANATPKKPPYKGPRIVNVYGNELWTELDPKVTNDQIRQKVVEDHYFPEFSKERTVYSLDEATGILCLSISFEKRG